MSNYYDSQSLTYLEPEVTVASNILPTKFTIECDSIYLHQKNIDLTIQIPTQKVEQLDYIIVNGIKFKKDRSK